MSQSTSTFSKFVGLTSLGLLTGSSLTLTLLTAPTLLSLPSTNQASQALTVLSSRASSLQRFLSQTSLVALIAAWTLSPREARHPYLIWTALPVLGLSGWEFWTTSSSAASARSRALGSNTRGDGRAKGKGKATGTPFGSGSEDEDGWRRIEEAVGADAKAQQAGSVEDEEINGESVRDGLVALRQDTTLKSAVYGFSFVLGLVGIWGDGY